jgi:hypothetical protein
MSQNQVLEILVEKGISFEEKSRVDLVGLREGDEGISNPGELTALIVVKNM